MAQWVRCLPYKREDMSSDPTIHLKSEMQLHTSIIPSWEEETGRSLGLPVIPAGRVGEPQVQ